MIEADLVGQARAIAREHAARTEADRRLAPEVVAALARAGVFKALVPRRFGGGEVGALAFVRTVEEIARGDGAAGWVAMICGEAGLLAGWLDDATAAEVFGPPDAIACGVFAPSGRGVPVDGGAVRVSGRWSLASGCELARWRMVGLTVERAGGEPLVRAALLPAAETRVVDTWDAAGLRGTGSHDLTVEDALVPAARVVSLLDRATRAGAIHALPFFGLLASGIAAVTLGLAQGALESFVELAGGKRPAGGRRTLAHRELAQLDVARAAGAIAAARAGVQDALGLVEREAAERGEASLPSRARLRIAACHAASECVASVDRLYAAAGASPVYAASVLGRCQRDARVAAQHLMVSATSATQAGRVLLGLDGDVAMI